MKTRSSIVQKVFCFFLLAALTLGICTPVLATSGTTTLATMVPSHCTVNLYISGTGTVTINGTALSQSGTVQVERNKQVTVQIIAAEYSYLKSVKFNETDITANVKDGNITLPALANDTALAVTFAAKSTSPATGDTSNIPLWIAFLFICCTGLISLCAADKKKETR